MAKALDTSLFRVVISGDPTGPSGARVEYRLTNGDLLGPGKSDSSCTATWSQPVSALWQNLVAQIKSSEGV